MLGLAAMATGYLAPVTALQVGSYFVGQYYQILQQQPNLVHQFYTDLSTRVHVDGSSSETNASGMLQIHNLITSLSFAGIEIKTAHSLESWNGGILEKGYFILNDIFLLHDDDEQMRHHHAPNSIHHNSISRSNDSLYEREAPKNGVTVPADVEESGPAENYYIPENDDAEEDEGPEEEEPIEEPTKHTYASILRAARAPASTERTAIALPEFEDVGGQQDEGEVKSVYVRNLPSTASASALEREFKNFGRIKPDGVLIKTRKEAGVYYAFVEFEDMTGVQNALQASPILFSGRQIYVEERRPGRGVKDRGGNQSEAAPQRGRLGSNRKFKGKGILGPQAILKNGHRSSVDSV